MVKQKQKKSVRVLNQEYYNQQTQLTEIQQQQLALTKKHRFHMLILLIVVLLITLGLGISIIKNNIQASMLNRKATEAKVELKDEKDKNKKLHQQVEQLKDSDYVAKIIRQKYYFSKDGETIYSLPGDKSKSVTDN